MNKKALSFLFFAIALSSAAVEPSERCPRCKRGDCGANNGEDYNPYARYYPYCLIYQDSRVKSYDSDLEDTNYWPAKRDDDLVDALTR